MNWVAPIKDEQTLDKYREALLELGKKYYVMFEIGIGTGMQVQSILSLKVKDVKRKDTMIIYIGTRKVRRSYRISREVKKLIDLYTESKRDEDYLFPGMHTDKPISREQVYRALKEAGRRIGLVQVGAQTMRKTFAWRYYQNTGDISYLTNLFNHASSSVTYRFIGEKPTVDMAIRKLTPEENERSRKLLYQDSTGTCRMEAVKDFMNLLEDEMDNPRNNDAFYGKVDVLLTEIEEIIKDFHSP